MTQRFAQVVTVRDGKVVRSETYSSPEEALAAVGSRDWRRQQVCWRGCSQVGTGERGLRFCSRIKHEGY